MDLISIIVTGYNAQQYIPKFSAMLLKQTYPNLEYIFINDGSTDGTLAALEQIKEDIITHRSINPDLIKIINLEHNSGIGIARATAISHASGKYIYMPDFDDEFDANLIQDAYNKAEAENADVVYFGSRQYLAPFNDDNKNPPYVDVIPSERATRPFFGANFCRDLDMGLCHWARLVRYDFLKKHSIQIRDIRTGDDTALGIDLFYHNAKIAIIPKVYYYYYYYTSSTDRPSYNSCITPLKFIELLYSYRKEQPYNAIVDSYVFACVLGTIVQRLLSNEGQPYFNEALDKYMSFLNKNYPNYAHFFKWYEKKGFYRLIFWQDLNKIDISKAENATKLKCYLYYRYTSYKKAAEKA